MLLRFCKSHLGAVGTPCHALRLRRLPTLPPSGSFLAIHNAWGCPPHSHLVMGGNSPPPPLSYQRLLVLSGGGCTGASTSTPSPVHLGSQEWKESSSRAQQTAQLAWRRLGAPAPRQRSLKFRTSSIDTSAALPIPSHDSAPAFTFRINLQHRMHSTRQPGIGSHTHTPEADHSVAWPRTRAIADIGDAGVILVSSVSV